MRYITESTARAQRVNMNVANISRTGSVLGMQKLYGWPVGGQIRIGGFIYNVGVSEVQRLRAAGVLKGEK